MNLITSLRSEIMKTRRTASFYLTIFAAAFGPAITVLEVFFEGIQKNDPKNLFNILFIEEFQVTGLLALPIFLILICALLPQIEYRNNTWKQVLSSPQTKADIFLSKFVNIQLLTLTFFIINVLFTFAGAVILNWKYPAFNILSQHLNGYAILTLRINTYLVLLGLCAIQFWLGLRFKNFIIPIAIGVACYFAGTILVMQLQKSLILYLPYTMFLYNGLPEYSPYADGLNWYSLAYTGAFLAIAFLNFRKRRMIG